MTQQGQTVALADTIVAVLTARQAAGQFAVSIAPVRRFLRRVDLSEIPDSSSPAAVDVFPGVDIEDREGGGPLPVFSATYSVHVVIEQQMAGTVTAETQFGLLMQVRTQIIECLKPLGLAVTTAQQPYRPAVLVKVECSVPYILNRFGNNQFTCEFVLTYKAAIGC